MTKRGQTTIETALVIMLLLIIFFGIAEISRAWWLKNQLNNAARVGVREAIVTLNITQSQQTCPTSGGGADQPVFEAIWEQVTNGQLCNTGIAPAIANLTIDVSGGTDPSILDFGDSVTVTVTGTFTSVVPGLSTLSMNLIPDGVTMTTSSTMRYER